MTLVIIVSLYRIITFDKQEPFLKWHVLSRGLWDCPNAEQPGLASPLDTMEPALSGVGLQSVALAAGFLSLMLLGYSFFTLRAFTKRETFFMDFLGGSSPSQGLLQNNTDH